MLPFGFPSGKSACGTALELDNEQVTGETVCYHRSFYYNSGKLAKALQRNQKATVGDWA